MPNVIVELNREMNRVRALLPKLPIGIRERAVSDLELAHYALRANSFEDMRVMIDELEGYKNDRKESEK